MHLTLKHKFQLLRWKRGLTQAELADAAGLCRTSIGHLETGERSFESISLANLQSVCKALGVSVSWFLDWKPTVREYADAEPFAKAGPKYASDPMPDRMPAYFEGL